MVHLGNDWDTVLAEEFASEYYQKIRYWLKKEYAEQTIFPPMEDIFIYLQKEDVLKRDAVGDTFCETNFWLCRAFPPDALRGPTPYAR